MTQKKDTQNEKLIQELYEKLWWYTHEASEEEFNEKEVDAIVQLLDVLEPIKEDHVFEPGAEAAFGRFKERFGLEEEFAEVEADMVEAAGTGDESSEAAPEIELANAENVADCGSVRKIRRKPDWKKIGIRVGIGIAACLVLMVSLELGTYALRKQSFFEVIRLGDRRTEIVMPSPISGNDSEQRSFESWEMLEEQTELENVEPEFVPPTYTVDEIILFKTDEGKIVKVNYLSGDNYLRIVIYFYGRIFEKHRLIVDDEWKIIEIKNNYESYSKNAEYLFNLYLEDRMYQIYSNEDISKYIIK